MNETITALNSLHNIEKRLQLLKDRVRILSSGGDSGGDEASCNRDSTRGPSAAPGNTRRRRNPTEDEGTRIFNELLTSLHEQYEPDSTSTTSTFERCEMFWDQFLVKLKALESTSLDFRKSCLFQMRNGYTLFHEVCRISPPVIVVKTLMDIVPTNEKKIGIKRQFNHLGCTPKRFGNEYPLHMIVRYGGTLEVVKVLLDADPRRETLKLNSENNSVYHVLVENREYHEVDEFTDILQYLVSILNEGGDFGESPLLRENERDCATPLLLLSGTLALRSDDELSMTELLNHRDFIFLTQATCYHYLMSKNATSSNLSRDNWKADMEKISPSRAFTICSTCFDERICSWFLKELLATNSKFLLELDAASGQYPIHQMIQNSSYLMDTISNPDRNRKFCAFIIQTILNIVPVCAQLFDDEGLLPLQIAADLGRTSHDYLNLVQIVLKAYPEAKQLIETLPDSQQRQSNAMTLDAQVEGVIKSSTISGNESQTGLRSRLAKMKISVGIMKSSPRRHGYINLSDHEGCVTDEDSCDGEESNAWSTPPSKRSRKRSPSPTDVMVV